MSRPLPVTLVAGFLGAGKTTLLNRLLAASSPLRVGVVQNERGLEGIDDAPVAARAKVEISEGCACCVRNPDLVAAVRDLSGRGDLDLLLFEASGLADPLPLAWTLGRPDLADRVRLDSVLTVVDACHFRAVRGAVWDARCAPPTSSTWQRGTSPASRRPGRRRKRCSPSVRGCGSCRTTLPRPAATTSWCAS